MYNNKKNLSAYFSKPSNDVNWDSCPVIKAFCFSDSVEATGISYKSHQLTLKKLEAEKNHLKQFEDLDEEIKPGLTVAKRLEQIDRIIEERKKKYKSRKKVQKKSKTKADNIISLKRSQKKLVHLLKQNFSNYSYCATLTYGVPKNDIKEVQSDFSKLREKLRYRFPKIAYIAIYEPYEKGNWHIHLVYKNAKGLKKDVFEKIWTYGYVYNEVFSGISSPYFVKNYRLEFYPSGARLYTASRNLKQPDVYEFTPTEFEKYIEKRNLYCVSATAKTLYKVDSNGEKRVNHFVYKNYQK